MTSIKSLIHIIGEYFVFFNDLFSDLFSKQGARDYSELTKFDLELLYLEYM